MSQDQTTDCPQTGDFFLAWWPDCTVPRIVRPIGPGSDIYETFWAGEALQGHPTHWKPLPEDKP